MPCLHRLALTLAVAALFAVPGQADAASWELMATNRLYSESLSEDLLFSMLRFPGTEAGRTARTAYQAHLLAVGAVRPVDVLGLQLGLDTGLLELGAGEALADGRPIGDRAKETLFLGETFVDLQLGPTGVVELRVGKLRPRIARGAIFDAYALGLDGDVDLSLVDDASPWRFHLGAFLPDATFTARGKTNPLLDLEVALQSRGGSELRLVGAAFFDNEDGLAPVLADAVFRGRITTAMSAVEDGAVRVTNALRRLSDGYNHGVVGYELETSGVVGWLGAVGKLRLDPLVLRATVLGGLGQLDTTTRAFGFDAYAPSCDRTRPVCRAAVDQYTARVTAPGPATVKLRSVFADLTAELALGDALAVDAFAVLMSGDDGFSRASASGTDTYRGFIGLAPLLDHSLIFFRGGVAGSLASPVVASIAPDGAGLLALGTGLAYTPVESIRVRASGALMASTIHALASKSRALGAELDLTVDAEVLDFLALSGSAGVFAPGAYFGDLPVGWQVIVGATLSPAQL